MRDDAKEPAETQLQHWQNTYTAHPGLYGEEPSALAVHAAQVFRAAGAKDVLELGAGHGRDALYFAREGFTVQATDFSPVGLEQLRQAARSQDVAERVSIAVHDVREPLPLADASVDAVFAHMLLCMALSTEAIHTLVGEVRRVLRPGGVLVHTARHTGDAHYGAGDRPRRRHLRTRRLRRALLPRRLVDFLADGWTLDEVHAFEEGDLPRRLWRVTQTSAPVSPDPIPAADITVDGTGLLCVTLLLRLRKQIEGAPPGTVVHVIATDPAAPLDL